jgi:hypothetical protein
VYDVGILEWTSSFFFLALPENLYTGIEINGRPWRVKFQLGDQILLCGRPVGK